MVGRGSDLESGRLESDFTVMVTMSTSLCFLTCKTAPIITSASGLLFRALYICGFSKWLLEACNVPGTVLGTGDGAMSKRHELVLAWVPALLSNKRIPSCS